MDIVSKEYAEQLKTLHDQNKVFGVGAVTAKHYPLLKNFILKKQITSILDYGCGKGHFIKTAQAFADNIQIDGFDVASEEYATLPNRRYELVVSLDVMEHVEYGALTQVLSEIRQRTQKYFICSIANYPANKTLSDGRNAHVTQIPFSSWFTLLSGFFAVDQFIRSGKAEGLFICRKMKTSSDWR